MLKHRLRQYNERFIQACFRFHWHFVSSAVTDIIIQKLLARNPALKTFALCVRTNNSPTHFSRVKQFPILHPRPRVQLLGCRCHGNRREERGGMGRIRLLCILCCQNLARARCAPTSVVTRWQHAPHEFSTPPFTQPI